MQATASLQSWDMWPNSNNINNLAGTPVNNLSGSFGSGSFGAFGFGISDHHVAHTGTSAAGNPGASALDMDTDSLISMSLSMFEEDLFFGLPLDSNNSGAGTSGTSGSVSGGTGGAAVTAAASTAGGATTATGIQLTGSSMQHHFSNSLGLGSLCDMMDLVNDDPDDEDDVDYDDLLDLHSQLAEELLFDMEEDIIDPVMQEVEAAIQAGELNSLFDQFERTEKTINQLLRNSGSEDGPEIVDIDQDVEIPFEQQVVPKSCPAASQTAGNKKSTERLEKGVTGFRIGNDGDKNPNSLLANKTQTPRPVSTGTVVSPVLKGTRNGGKEKRRKKKKSSTSGGMSLLAKPKSSHNIKAPTASPVLQSKVQPTSRPAAPALVVLRPQQSQNLMRPVITIMPVTSVSGCANSYTTCTTGGMSTTIRRISCVPMAADHDYCPSGKAMTSTKSTSSSSSHNSSSSSSRPSDALG